MAADVFLWMVCPARQDAPLSRQADSSLPRTIIISIMAFALFDCEEFHSELRCNMTAPPPAADIFAAIVFVRHSGLLYTIATVKLVEDGFVEAFANVV
jgi:hypothetical protein